jgi:hypothetical protein
MFGHRLPNGSFVIMVFVEGYVDVPIQSGEVVDVPIRVQKTAAGAEMHVHEVMTDHHGNQH